MKLTVFHAGDGDSLLLTSSDSKRVLVDGGRTAAFERHIRPTLSTLKSLDVVCVSHIDDDHITGVVRLFEDIVEWRAYKFADAIGEASNKPSFDEPPQIGEVWHNGLYVLVGDDLAPKIQEVLVATATLMAGSSEEETRDLASQMADLATGEKASMELSRRISNEQLGIPLNKKTNGNLLQRAKSGAPINGEDVDVGTMKFLLLGPSEDDIKKLKTQWATWVNNKSTELAKLQAEMLADEQRIGALHPKFVANPMATDLGAGFKNVSAPNLASLMFLVVEHGKTVLLTGDGVSDEILDGLKRHGKLGGDGRIHVDVLKVQHHGAKANVSEKFVNAVTADHYVFCGNGASKNPEPEVVEAFAQVRSTGYKGKPAVQPNKKFKFWFTTNPTMKLTEKQTAHMQEVEQLVATLRAKDQNLDAEFLTNASSFEIPL